jgi:hydrogenase maturation protease
MRCVVGDILVLGYGNELRGDDGLGPFVAQSLAEANLPGVRVLTAVQLLPEWAADLAEAQSAVFVDASLESSEREVTLRPLPAQNTMDWCTHRADPRALLALTQAIYERTPQAWWLTVPGRHFEFGGGLSSVAVENARQALACLESLIRARSVRP